ncbi:MAG: DNA-processing protein DprA [Eubacteriales bacterium]|nr:DNA-processing protein DprA [Eubacteriales bacterium]
MKENIIYSLWLTSLTGMGIIRQHSVIDAFKNPQNAYNATRQDIECMPGLSTTEKKILCDKDLSRAEAIYRECTEKGIKIISYESEDFPQLLLEIPDFPVVLYVLGTLGNMTEEFPLAMVGTRHPSVYGSKMAEKFSYEIAAAGMTIVSGMARGVDSICHKGALKAGMRTIAVLGCGVDVVYPPENEQLKKVIESSGAVISEFPPGSAPLASHFPQRNRIISGMSLATMIVECEETSGTMITAGFANEYNRTVYTVPTNLDNKHGLGNIALAKDGAQFVYSPEDIYRDFIQSQPERVASAWETKENNPINNYNNYILGILSGSIPTGIDRICEMTGLSIKEINAKMTLLELEGRVNCLSGQRYVLK